MRVSRLAAIPTAMALSVLAACSRQPGANAVSSAVSAPAATPAQADVRTISGAVVETMDASSYTYVRVRTASGDVWAATTQFKVAVGDRVVLALEMPMENFHSQALNRDFPLIYFTPRIALEGEAARPPLMAAHSPTRGSTPSSAVPQLAEPVAPARGGIGIADLWVKRTAFAGKVVTVRGQVVKFNGGILDRNWLHIQDGTGSATDGSNDLAVTTSAVVKIGDIVTATGTVAIDKDFGAGYAYKVIVEGATVLVK